MGTTVAVEAMTTTLLAGEDAVAATDEAAWTGPPGLTSPAAVLVAATG